MKFTKLSLALSASMLILSGCNKAPETTTPKTPEPEQSVGAKQELLVDESRLSIYHPVSLTADLSHLDANQKEMIAVCTGCTKAY